MELVKKEPIIFIVSGKANSGKDTSCELINSYIKRKGLKTINLQFSYYIKMYASKITNWDGSEDTKPRALLQRLGTEIIREKIDHKFFIKRIIGDIKVYSYYFDVITVSDARLPDEIEDIYNEFENVVRINIKRPDFINKLDEQEKIHHTEKALDDYDKFDYFIMNDGSVDELNSKIINIIDEVI